MSRSNYNERDKDNWAFIKWRGQVASAIRGKRGQAFLRELLAALEAMPEKRLISNHLRSIDGEVCALGALGRARGIDLESVDPDDYDTIADIFGVAHQVVREIEFENDEVAWRAETPEKRWQHMHAWIERQLRPKMSE